MSVIAVFGATGNAGSGALEASLESSTVTEVRAFVRRPLGISHPKLREIHCSNFANLADVEHHLKGVDACLYCLGTSVRNTKSEEEYRLIHVTYPLAAAEKLKQQSPDAAFVYISGAGTNEKSFMMWARVKGESESKLARLNLKREANVRPGGIVPKKPRGIERWLVNPLVKVFPLFGISSIENGRAMLRLGLDKSWSGVRTLENRELKQLSMQENS